MIQTVTSSTTLIPKSPQDSDLMQKAMALEATFLSELMGYSGLGRAEGGFDGGIGEAQFESFLRAEQAKLMVERGGIGLADLIFESLKESGENADGTP